MSKAPTTDEWLAELARCSPKRNDEGFTTREWAIRSGISFRKMADMLRMAYERGWLLVGKRSIVTRDGRQSHTNVYRIVKPKAGSR